MKKQRLGTVVKRNTIMYVLYTKIINHFFTIKNYNVILFIPLVRE